MSAELDILGSPVVARTWLVELDMPDGMVRLHQGVGKVEAGGRTWQGIADPAGGRLVSVGKVRESRGNGTPSVQIIIGACTVEYAQTLFDLARQTEGRPARLYWLAVDEYRQLPILGPTLYFNGRFTAPARIRKDGIRHIVITLESYDSGINFAPMRMWSDIGQRRRYPGDRGGEWFGVRVQEDLR